MSRLLVRDPREISDSLVAAVLDFCRRAKRPSTPEEVRLALARLPEERERDLRMAASREPPATPLSPQAFVDWVEGMPPDQAAALEEAGAYLAMARQAAAEALEMQLARPAQEEAKPLTPIRRRRKATKTPPVLVRRRRTAEPSATRTEPETPSGEGAAAEAGASTRPGRSRAAPRFGRFVSGRPAKRPIQELEAPEGADILLQLVGETDGNLRALLDRVNLAWAEDGRPIGAARLEALLRRHQIEEQRRRIERDRLRTLLRRERGFDRPVARAWKLSPRELRRLIQTYGLAEEVEELRARARADILAETQLSARLALLFRQQDRLRALGVYREVRQAAAHELRERVDTLPLDEKIQAPEVLLEMVRRQEGIDRGLWRWATEAFDLLAVAARRLGIPLAPTRPRHPGHGRLRPPRMRNPRPDRR